MVSMLDDMIGQIVQALKERGMWEDTLIVYLADVSTLAWLKICTYCFSTCITIKRKCILLNFDEKHCKVLCIDLKSCVVLLE